MARSNRLKSVIARQKKLDRSNAPVILSEKAQRKAKRERRAYFRERYACSGRRLIKLQQEDPDSLYIGFVGTNSAGRAQALVAVEAYLKRATELKVKGRLLYTAVLLYNVSKSSKLVDLNRSVKGSPQSQSAVLGRQSGCNYSSSALTPRNCILDAVHRLRSFQPPSRMT